MNYKANSANVGPIGLLQIPRQDRNGSPVPIVTFCYRLEIRSAAVPLSEALRIESPACRQGNHGNYGFGGISAWVASNSNRRVG
jgi:hypothetical protein